MMHTPTNLSAVLRYLRKSRHYTQKELSHFLHVSIQAYSHYETGLRIPSCSILEALAEYYDISYALLLAVAFADVRDPAKTKEMACSESSCLIHTISKDAFILLDQFRQLDDKNRQELLDYIKRKVAGSGHEPGTSPTRSSP